MHESSHWRNRLIAAVALIMAGAGDAAGQGAPPVLQTAPAVLQTMSPAEAQATGIERLTPAERQRLEGWIVRLASNVARITASSACAIVPGPAAAADLESRIAGDFTGWDGSTVVVLENGQLWQQASFDRVAVYMTRPRVSLLSDGREWRMSVEGAGRAVPVRRVR